MFDIATGELKQKRALPLYKSLVFHKMIYCKSLPTRQSLQEAKCMLLQK
jgi:hypothetical protein